MMTTTGHPSLLSSPIHDGMDQQGRGKAKGRAGCLVGVRLESGGGYGKGVLENFGSRGVRLQET